MEVRLRLNKEDADDISFERVHRVGKPSASEGQPRPLMAKFTFHRDKEFFCQKQKIFGELNSQLLVTFLRRLLTKEGVLFHF